MQISNLSLVISSPFLSLSEAINYFSIQHIQQGKHFLAIFNFNSGALQNLSIWTPRYRNSSTRDLLILPEKVLDEFFFWQISASETIFLDLKSRLS